MKISKFLNQSLIDYSGKLSSVVFSTGCNYRCPGCHAKHILDGNDEIRECDIFSYLDSRKNLAKGKRWLDGVVLCGGEPTLQSDLLEFSKKLKEMGFGVKLDTNGSNPDVLESLLKEKSIDYVALDVKGPAYLYPALTGSSETCKVEKSMNLAMRFPDYEFRTTIVPVKRGNKEISFLTGKEIIDTAKWIYESTQSNIHKYYIQSFVARSKDEMIDEAFSKENLPEKMHQTPYSLMQEYEKTLKDYLPKCEIR